MSTPSNTESPTDHWPAIGGEMGERVRDFDWSQTALGPMEAWSPALRMMVRFLLANRFPLLLWWGPEYVSIYNDSYRPVLGAKHPWALGRPVRECWNEIWHILQPLIDTPFNGGPATWNDDISLEINRHGFIEETHFTIAYSPVPDETAPGGIGGVLATVHEISEKVIGERRVRALRDLGARVGEAKQAQDACAVAATTLAAYEEDVPFALFYLIDGDGEHARLAGASGVEVSAAVSPCTVDLRETGSHVWPLAEVRTSESMQVVTGLGERFAGVPRGPWSDAPDTAVVLPIRSNLAGEPAGMMVLGVSARSRLDESYRGFFELLATQVATAVASARAYEEERKRAQALAELDQAKTQFFSNVSHEFRTPLTLILGPLEDAVAETAEGPERDRLELLRRNALRLQKLVNTLLDFSRIEAGRIQASFEPTDLSELTRELASVFRSAVEKARMRLIVCCPPLSEPVYVDRDLYEKIVLNLISNAFKYTLEGEIEVALEEAGPMVELTVRDTGAGIPSDQLPRVFERFHRIASSRARTQEGTGIGLALVRELVKLHGGTVSVRSVLGRGSVFSVAMPKGRAHLPADRVGARRELLATTLAADHYVEEALRWLPVADAKSPAAAAAADQPVAVPRSRVVWADDNADMRDYVTRLLEPLYDVEAVPDGEAALAAVRREPADLVLADVMMPRLDGFGLLRALRTDQRTAAIPVILLSARAGEEARVEGMQAGADDYLVKPFTARDLLTRVWSHVEMARLRRSVADTARAEAEAASEAKSAFLATMSHELRTPLNAIIGYADLLGAEIAGPLTSGQRSQLERIEISARHLLLIIQEILTFSRLEAGREDVQLQKVDLAELARETCRLVEPLAAKKGIAFECRAPASLWAQSDPGKVRQILLNLLSNAVKFTEAGEVRLEVRRDGEGVFFRVSDTGIGIAREHQDRIFEPFAQVASPLHRGGGGTGLGLSVTRSLAELLGGHTSVESRPGEGSTFAVRLPLTPGDCDEVDEEATWLPTHASSG